MKSEAKALTITYVTPVSFASLNGSDKESDNVSSIKKISVGTDQYPYVSGQAIRRALRNQLKVLDWKLSEGVKATIEKGAATTEQEPEKYIDDDLFGFMGTEVGKAAKTRTSVVRVSPLVALNPYQGDLDFGTNYMGKASEGNPNIFETEIHAGLYRGTILIELDRVGCGDGFTEKSSLDNKEKSKRVKGLLLAIKNLWSSGRQSRTLSDISPKFVIGAMLKTKNPIFLESVQIEGKKLNCAMLKETLTDYQNEIVISIAGMRQGFFETDCKNVKSIGDAFDQMAAWIDEYYK